MKLFIFSFLLFLSQLSHSQSLDGFTNAGSGCGPGTVSVSAAPDGSSLSVLYSALTAHVAGPVTNDQKDCEVYVWINKPKLATFTIESADFRGGVILENGVEARQRVTVESGNSGPIMRVMSSFADQVWRGPISQEYNVRTIKPVQAPIALSCIPLRKQAKIRIKVKAGVKSTGAGQGLLTVDSADAKVEHRYNLRWANCVTSGIDLIRGLTNGRLGEIDLNHLF